MRAGEYFIKESPTIGNPFQIYASKNYDPPPK
jgi:hypothetical protein